MNISNDVSNFVLDLGDRSHLFVGVESLVLGDFLGESVGLLLNAVLCLDLSFGVDLLFLHDLVNFLERNVFLLVVVHVCAVLGFFGDFVHIFRGGGLPLVEVDLFALVELALDALQDALESLVGEIARKEVGDLFFADFAVLESGDGFLDHAADIGRQLLMHSCVDLVVNLLLLEL